MAMIVPMWGGEKTPTFEALHEQQAQRNRVTTREEIEAAESVARSTAAAFGLI
jgi:hypothetical protein